MPSTCRASTRAAASAASVGTHVSGGEARAPAADRQQGEVDGRSCQLREELHVGVERGVPGEPDDDTGPAHEHPGGPVGPVRHGAGLVVGPYEEHLDPAPDGVPLAVGRLGDLQALSVDPRGVRRVGDDGHVTEPPE